MTAEQKAKVLLRRVNVFQAWRMCEPPFERRDPNMYSASDMEKLLDDIVEVLGEYISLIHKGVSSDSDKVEENHVSTCKCKELNSKVSTENKSNKKTLLLTDGQESDFGFIQP